VVSAAFYSCKIFTFIIYIADTVLLRYVLNYRSCGTGTAGIATAGTDVLLAINPPRSAILQNKTINHGDYELKK
jgi:hypothetical protein